MDTSLEPTPQAVLAPLTGSAIFLVLTINKGGENTVRDVLSNLSGLERSVGFRYPDGHLSCIAGIGPDAWDRLFAGPRPANLHPLPEFVGDKHRSVSTPGDLLLHIRARQMFLCFELALQTLRQFGDAVAVVDETQGFQYFDERDLLGFVDGTENPSGAAADRAALVTERLDPGFAGSSYVIVQKYLHDLPGWNQLPVEQQEQAIGRSKLDDIEMDEGAKPANAHTVLASVVDEDGTERKILRANMPFGSLQRKEYGTYFIGYASDPRITETMLANMFVGSPRGTYDRILDFSTAVTGTLFFVPTQDFLDDLPDAPAQK